MPMTLMRASRPLVLALMAIQLAGCTHWGQPMATHPEPSGESVRVWHGGKSTVIQQASFTADSVVGTYGAKRVRTAFARAEVDSLNVRRSDLLGTAILVGLAVALVKLITFAIDFGSYSNN